MNSKLKNKIIITLATMCMCLFAFGATLGLTNVAKADVASVTDVTITVSDGAEIKASAPMGIRFEASLSEADYNSLTSIYETVSYGFLIAPKDYVTNSDEMTLAGWDDVVEYTGTAVAGTKYFQHGTVAPSLDNTDNTYKFYGSFVGINENNYDREFIVRAYVAGQNGDSAPVYQYSNASYRAVYSVATGAAAKGSLSGDIATYINGVIDSVNAKNAGVSYTFATQNLTHGKQVTDALAEGDTFSVIATYTNSFGGTIDAMATVESNPKITDNGNGTYTVNNGGYEFDFTAVIKGASESIEDTIHVAGIEYVGECTTLDATAFKTNGTTTMTVATENIPAGAEGKTVYEVAYSYTASAGKNKVDSVYLDKPNISAGKYFTFKYYNDGIKMIFLESSANVYGGTMATTGIYNNSTGAWSYGQIKHYDENGQLIIGLDGVNATVGQWVTVEMYFDAQLPNCKIDFALNENYSVPEKVYFTDFTVSNYSVANNFKELEITLSGGKGTDGAFNPGDEVVVSATVGVKGQAGRVTLDASRLNLTFTDGAVQAVGGKYIYQGTGNFDVTCTYWNTTDTASATGIVGAVVSTMPLSSVTPKSNKVTIENATTGIPAGAPSGNILLATFADDGSGMSNCIQISSTGLTKDNYITIRYYLTEHNMEFGEGIYGTTKFPEGTASLSYYGNPVFTQYAADGTLITNDTFANYKNQWVSMEIKFGSAPNSNALRIALNPNYKADKTFYFQVCVSEQSLRPNA